MLSTPTGSLWFVSVLHACGKCWLLERVCVLMQSFLPPLQGFVLIITIIREAVEEIRCYVRDKEVNSQIYSKLSTRGKRLKQCLWAGSDPRFKSEPSHQKPRWTPAVSCFFHWRLLQSLTLLGRHGAAFFLLFVHIFNISRTKNTQMIFPESSEMLLSLQTTENILKAQKFFADIGSRLLISQNQHLLTVGGGSY